MLSFEATDRVLESTGAIEGGAEDSEEAFVPIGIRRAVHGKLGQANQRFAVSVQAWRQRGIPGGGIRVIRIGR